MKVLFVASLYRPHVGGIETMITELCRFYHTQGIETVVLTKKWPNTLPEHDTFEGTEIHRVITARTRDEFLEVNDWLKENHYKIKADVIHTIGVRRPLPLVAVMLARLWNVPVISSISGGDIPDAYDPEPGMIWDEGKEVVPGALIQSDVVNCVSESLSRDLRVFMPEIKKIETLYAGIEYSNIQEAKPEKIREQYIYSLRRLDPSKGIDLLIKAFNIVKDTFPKLDLVISGEGSEEPMLRALVNEYHLNDRVIFTGTVDLPRAMSLLKGSVMTVVPSLSEGGGLINVEAQAAGIPVIASRVGGIPEYISEGESGILFESGNYKELAEKIKLVLSDNTLREKLIAGGYKHAKLFDWNVLAPQYLELYKKTIKEHTDNFIFKPWSPLTTELWEKLTK